jgi:hypothetical protein
MLGSERDAQKGHQVEMATEGTSGEPRRDMGTAFGQRTAASLPSIALGEITAGRDIVLHSIDRIRTADPSNVQQIAASQLELLAGYHEMVLAQSRRSFFWALVGSGVGLAFFVGAVGFSLATRMTLSAIVPLLSGAIVEVVAGLVFVLYGRTASQLSSFYSRLEVLQRYLLANSICDALDGEERNKARAALVQEISRGQLDSVQNSTFVHC